ncbi:MAG: hypothetical protein GY771_01245 [bacterium]|nr:hypothetical protein [bacterium]
MGGDYKVLTWPNLVTVSRLLIALPGFYLMWIGGNKLVILGIFAVVFLSDLLDGYLARKLDQFSEVGKMLDPLIDKIITAACGAILILSPHYYLPIWIAAVVIGKDVILVLSGSLILGKRAKAIPANIWGKIAVVLASMGGVAAFLGIPNLYITVLFIVIAIGQVVALVSYISGAVKILRSETNTETL